MPDPSFWRDSVPVICPEKLVLSEPVSCTVLIAPPAPRIRPSPVIVLVLKSAKIRSSLFVARMSVLLWPIQESALVN